MLKARLFEIAVNVVFVAALAVAVFVGVQYAAWAGAGLGVLVMAGFPYLFHNHDAWIVRPLVASDDKMMLHLCQTGFVGRARKLLGKLPSDPRCRFCHVPFAGAGRMLRIQPSAKNPNYCRSCFEGLPVGGHEIDVGILFADIRGFTAWTEQHSPSEAAEALTRFYATANRVLTPDDAFVEFVGDQVMAMYPVLMPSLAERTPEVMFAGAQRLLAALREDAQSSFPVGIGINLGVAQVGNLGKGEAKDFTAVGDLVNTTARLQSSAASGEIVLSESVYDAIAPQAPEAKATSLELKGKAEPLRAYVVPAAA